jgi:hypothetical protein
LPAPVNLSDSCSLPTSVCTPQSCRNGCALEVIDHLLSTQGAASGEEADLLLDLRWKLRQCTDAEEALRLFCELRRRMERRHYLAFFRIRRWLENHLVARVRICPAAEDRTVRVKLDHYCVEAIRRVALCAGLGGDAILLAPRLQFAFAKADATLVAVPDNASTVGC